MTKEKKEPKKSARKAAAESFTAGSDENLAKGGGAAAQPPHLANLMKDDRATIRNVYDYLSRGCDPNQPDEDGKTPIELAIERHWVEAAMMLKQSGAVPPKFDGNAEGDPNLPYLYKPRNDGWISDDRGIQREMADNTAFGYYVRKMARPELIVNALVNGADVNMLSDRKSPLEITQTYREGGEWTWLATQLVRLGAWRNPASPDPNETVNQTTGATRLLALILEGKDFRAIERTLTEGADPDKPDRQGLTPLAAALAVKWPAVEELLVRHGAKQDVALPDPDQLVGDRYNDNKKPLLTYAMHGGNMNANFFVSLLEAGANPDFAGPSGMTTAYMACVHRHIWHLEHLYANGADLTIPEKGGMTPLGIACMNNSLEVVEWLDGRIPDEQFTLHMGKTLDTPLHHAVHRENAEELVAFLLSKGADPNATNAEGETPLQVAAERKGNAKALHLMVQASGKVKDSINKKDKNGYTALDAAISGSTLDPATVRYLLQQGADVKEMSPGTDKGNPALFEMLSANWRDEDGKRAKAVREILEMLVEKGIDFNLKGTRKNWNSDFNTSLIYAASEAIYTKTDNIDFMLTHGADVYGTSHQGQSMAHRFVSRHNVEGMKMLLKHGFDPLKHWEFVENWSNGPHAHAGTILDEVRMLYMSDKHYKREAETQPLLDLIEGHLKAKGVDTAAIPYPVMLAPTFHEHQEALGKKWEAEEEAREKAAEKAKPAKPKAPRNG